MLVLLIINLIFIIISQYTILFTLIINQSVTKKELIIGVIPIVGAILGVFIFLVIILSSISYSYDVFKTSLKKINNE